jgi:hypothetical protein
MIKSKLLGKISGLPAEDVEHKKEGFKKRFDKNAGIQKSKPYPVPEEDSFTPPDDDSAEIKYMAKEKLAKTSKPGA